MPKGLRVRLPPQVPFKKCEIQIKQSEGEMRLENMRFWNGDKRDKRKLKDSIDRNEF